MSGQQSDAIISVVDDVLEREQTSDSVNTLTRDQKALIANLGQHEVTMDEIDVLLTLFYDMKDAVDTSRRGNVTADDVAEGLAWLKQTKHAHATNAAKIDYSLMPACLQDVLKTWDADGKKTISCVQLSEAASAWKAMQQENRLVKRMMIAVLLVVTVMLAGVFVLSYMTAQLVKDMRPDDHGALLTTDGQVVQTASTDLIVGEDGTLCQRNTASQNYSATQISGEGSIKTLQKTLSLPQLRFGGGGRRLADGRRLTEALGLEDFADEAAADSSEVQQFLAAAHTGSTQFMYHDGDRAGMSATLFAFETLSEDVDTHHLASSLFSDSTEMGVLAACLPEEVECAVLLPKMTSSQVEAALDAMGGNVSNNAARRLGWAAVWYGFRMALKGVSAGVKVATAISGAIPRRREPRRRRGGGGSCFPFDAVVSVYNSTINAFGKVSIGVLDNGQQVLSGYSMNSGVRFEPVLLEFHSPTENRRPAVEYMKIVHEEGVLELSMNHFVRSVERGMIPAKEVGLGEHIYALPQHLQDMKELPTGEVAFLESEVLSLGTLRKAGMFAKLTYSGELVVNGVVASSYTSDEFEQFLSDEHKRAAIIQKYGHDGVHKLIHAVAMPIRMFHTYAPQAWRTSKFWSPSDENAGASEEADGQPLYVGVVGTAIGAILDALLR